VVRRCQLSRRGALKAKEKIMRLPSLLLMLAFVLVSTSTFAAPVTIDLRPSAANPTSPRMGDNLTFHSVIRNGGATPVDGVIAWISLIQTDQGKEQPVDLEDWSAHKAVTAASLPPGHSIETDWPMRLIQAGTYRVVISAMTQGESGLAASPSVEFSVRQKAVVESQRILPVALGIPLLIGGLLVWRHTRRGHSVA
jgi:hypothetical protein